VNERNIKETMSQVHISERMQEDLIMNIQKKMENGNKKAWNWGKTAAATTAAATMAAVVLAAGIGSTPVRAVVQSVVKARMENIPLEELQALENTIQEQTVQADGFSREYSAKEQERSQELWQLYEDGTFPEKEILQVDNPDAVTEGTLCYVKATGSFCLPEREMTDEELLEIIDFQHMMMYAIEQSPAAQEARAEYQAEKDLLEAATESAEGISEEEAIEIAQKQMESELGERAAGKELLKDVNGCSAFLTDISAQTDFEHERDIAYIVGFGNPHDRSTYTCTIDAVDGSVLQTVEHIPEK